VSPASPGGLDLALIGNGTVGALVNPQGEIVWACFPRFDGDPMFCSLLRTPGADPAPGVFAIDLVDAVRSEQEYLLNTPVVVTRVYDGSGGAIEITDVAPRFHQFGRMFCPMMLVRGVRRIAGSPRIRLRVTPAVDYGVRPAPVTWGSNHVRYEGLDLAIRLTTDAPISAVLEQNAFFLEDSVTLLLGPDETVEGTPAHVGHRLLEETVSFWREWVRSLAIPYEWQDAVIRAAITLELNVFEDTGAIVAAMTTSIPEAAGSQRNWDYRYCWIRDGAFVVNALNRLGNTRTMERYLAYILNVVAAGADARLQPVYGITGHPVPDERDVPALSGYLGMGPVRVGNQAHRQVQHDVYGSAILAATHVFFDHRLVRRGDEALFRRLESLGDQAASLYDQPDAGIWELRGAARVHTFSSLMCWAACDRLARIAGRLGLDARARHWRETADRIKGMIGARAWNDRLSAFVSTADGTGQSLDASLLRLADVGFLAPDDPRFVGTVQAIERTLKRGDFILRYDVADDFGTPQNAFLLCTFWYINALAALGRRDEARALFERVLACRNRHGLLAEHVDPKTGDPWGNFVQTYSMVGVIDSAVRLSTRWDQAL
jgi:GH15 family glucan-1,4-alpha-glucosidase